jgi:glutathione synthase/RimK-type ligase-like ATP-grasp enzyme
MASAPSDIVPLEDKTGLSAGLLGLIGNPENRRIVDFTNACLQLGYRAPLCLSYGQILDDPSCLERWQVDLVRIDSPGENEQVARSLIALGGGPSAVDLDFGEIAYLKEYHLGYCRILELIRQSGLPCLNLPADIETMFDKWACHRRFLQQGVRRPPAELAPASFSLLREQMKPSGGRLFLKPLHGSSASGVCALRWSPNRIQLFAPIRKHQGKLFNCLRVSRFESLADIEEILEALLPQGMIAERWIPKLALEGGVLDLRVLVIEGTARHRVVRQSFHPMTNLHLGNRRGEERVLRQHLGERRWREALELAEQAAAAFANSRCVGVDILLDTAGQAWVAEVNAFGDLLPGLTHRGESAYAALARVCHAKSSPLRSR